jgi:hypothetical protein
MSELDKIFDVVAAYKLYCKEKGVEEKPFLQIKEELLFALYFKYNHTS